MLTQLAAFVLLNVNCVSVWSKTGDDGVSMEDLDQLQLDLEKLLSTCAVRIRCLLSEIGEVAKTDETGRKVLLQDKC